MPERKQFDVAIIGSGFSGSILASILAKKNLRVAMIDSAEHPRFAIGESSTPIADLVLRRLGLKYDLPALVSLSTWGSWQRELRDVSCGRKRGFSYFVHTHGQAFEESTLGEQSLLVAASAHDDVADTHWYRPEVDEFLFSHAIAEGVTTYSNAEVIGIESIDSGREVTWKGHEGSIVADWVIDASGRAGVTAKLCGGVSLVDQLQTCTHSFFGHYRNVGKWTDHLREHGDDWSAIPFNPDDAAQHHLLENGWMWMLRFNNDITSVGYTSKLGQSPEQSGYPSIDAMMKQATCVAPKGLGRAAALQPSGRLQRFYDPVISDRIAMLPTAAVTIDPLHSTGIAHALAGVDRVANLLLEPDDTKQAMLLVDYRNAVIDETRLADRLVHTAYETMHDFPRFTAACMLYFAGAIRCEERYQAGELPPKLWNSDDEAFVEFVNWACDLLCDPTIGEFHAQIQDRLKPWNTAGLLNPAVHNRYEYTATKSANS